MLSGTYSLSRSGLQASVLNLAAVLGFAVLTAFSAKLLIPLPFSPVPITLQSFAVLLSGMILGSKRGALSQISLILMGAAGLPVFSLPLPGHLVLIGPTGGYIMGFVLAAYMAGRVVEDRARLGFVRELILIHLASLFIFLPGTIWLSQFTGQSLAKAAMIGLLPFLPGDIVKCTAAVLFRRGLKATQAAKN